MGGWTHGYMERAGEVSHEKNMLDMKQKQQRYSDTIDALKEKMNSPDVIPDEKPRIYQHYSKLASMGPMKAKDKDLDISYLLTTKNQYAPKYGTDEAGKPNASYLQMSQIPQVPFEGPLQPGQQPPGPPERTTAYTPYEKAQMDAEKAAMQWAQTAPYRLEAKGPGAMKQLLKGQYMVSDLKKALAGTDQANDPRLNGLDDNDFIDAYRDSLTGKWEISPEKRIKSVGGGKYMNPATGQYEPARLNPLTQELEFPAYADSEGRPVPMRGALHWIDYQDPKTKIGYSVGVDPNTGQYVQAVPKTLGANLVGRTTQREATLDIGGFKTPIIYTTQTIPNGSGNGPSLPITPQATPINQPIPPPTPTGVPAQSQPGFTPPPAPGNNMMNTAFTPQGIAPNTPRTSKEAIVNASQSGGMAAGAMGGILGLPEVALAAIKNVTSWIDGKPLTANTPVKVTDNKGKMIPEVSRSVSADFTPTMIKSTPKGDKFKNSIVGYSAGIGGKKMPIYAKTAGPLTQMQAEKLHQNEATTRQSLDRIYRAYGHIGELSNLISAGKINLSLDPSTSSQLIVRAIGLNDKEAEIASDFISLTEDIQKMREPMGAAGFRSLEAFMALQRQRGTPIAHQALTKNVLKNTLKVFLSLHGTALSTLNNDANTPNTPDRQTYRMYIQAYGTGKETLIRSMTRDGWDMSEEK